MIQETEDLLTLAFETSDLNYGCHFPDKDIIII